MDNDPELGRFKRPIAIVGGYQHLMQWLNNINLKACSEFSLSLTSFLCACTVRTHNTHTQIHKMHIEQVSTIHRPVDTHTRLHRAHTSRHIGTHAAPGAPLQRTGTHTQVCTCKHTQSQSTVAIFLHKQDPELVKVWSTICM